MLNNNEQKSEQKIPINVCVNIVATGSGSLGLGSHIHAGGYCALLAEEGVDLSGLSWGCQLFSCADDFSGRDMRNLTVPSKYTKGARGTTKLGCHALVGAGSILLPKVILGDGVAVRALSLVTKDLDAWGIYSGVPAQRIKERKRDLLELERDLMLELGRR